MIKKLEALLKAAQERGEEDTAMELEKIINSIDDEAYQAAEAADYERFHRDAYGPEDDMTSSRDAIYNDRLSMGRNDAGEWLGFM